MALFLLAVFTVFVVTGGCALVEAALYAVSRPYIGRLVESGHPAGKLLHSFKQKMDYPITAILIFDTLLGVGGAAIAGSQGRALYGEKFVYWFTLGLAITLLVFAQIVPKVLGVAYNQAIAKVAAFPIAVSIRILYPVVRAVEFFTRHLKPDEPAKQAIEADVKQLARISLKEGSILDVEADLIQNSLKLDDFRAQQIMTPRDRTVFLSADLTIREAFKSFRTSSHSRLPIHEPGNPDRWTNLVFSREILFAMAHDQFEKRLDEIARPLHFVPAEMRGHHLLDAFLKRRTHLFAVGDKSGKTIGVVSLEDVIEELLGQEIEDEKELPAK